MSRDSKPPLVDVFTSVEDKLTAGIQAIAALEVGFYPKPNRAIDKIRLSVARDVTAERYYEGLSADEMKLLHTLLHG